MRFPKYLLTESYFESFKSDFLSESLSIPVIEGYNSGRVVINNVTQLGKIKQIIGLTTRFQSEWFNGLTLARVSCI